MKRCVAMLMLFVMLLPLLGCKSKDTGSNVFYYSRDPDFYQYFEDDGVIQWESRDLSGHREDLRYMIGLYLAGPMEEGLVSPFPRTVRLLAVEKQGSSIEIELTDHSTVMSDSEFSLACACLTLTCMDYVSCEKVTITSGPRSITMTADSLLLSDTLPQQETTGGST